MVTLSISNDLVLYVSNLVLLPFASFTALFHSSFPQVVDIMRVNVDKVLERDQKLSELDDRADALQAGASQFETSAAKLKNKYWWKNAKVRTFRHAFLNSKHMCMNTAFDGQTYHRKHQSLEGRTC